MIREMLGYVFGLLSLAFFVFAVRKQWRQP
jgi:hypothetical protein